MQLRLDQCSAILLIFNLSLSCKLFCFVVEVDDAAFIFTNNTITLKFVIKEWSDITPLFNSMSTCSLSLKSTSAINSIDTEHLSAHVSQILTCQLTRLWLDTPFLDRRVRSNLHFSKCSFDTFRLKRVISCMSISIGNKHRRQIYLLRNCRLKSPPFSPS